MRKLVIVGLSILLLMGCKSELKISLKLSQLSLNKPLKTTMPLIIVVPDCHNPATPSQPSESLRNMRALLSETLPASQYKSCLKHNAISQATFMVPLQIGDVTSFKGYYEPGVIYLMGNAIASSNAKGKNIRRNEDAAILVGMSRQTKKAILAQKKRIGSSMLTSDSRLIIYLENDGKSMISNLTGTMLYANNLPFIMENSVLPEIAPGQRLSIQLSDVLADTFLAGQKETYPVLSFAQKQ